MAPCTWADYHSLTEGAHGVRTALPHSRQGAEKERRDQGQDTIKDPTPMTYFLQLGPPPEVSEPPASCELSKCPAHEPQGTFYPETLADDHPEGHQLRKAQEHKAGHTHLISSMQWASRKKRARSILSPHPKDPQGLSSHLFLNTVSIQGIGWGSFCLSDVIQGQSGSWWGLGFCLGLIHDYGVWQRLPGRFGIGYMYT